MTEMGEPMELKDTPLKTTLVSKLHTHHDRFFLHKGIGVLCLSNYAWRFGRLILTGSMGFERGDPWTLVTILLHAFLSVSALIFRVPVTRRKSVPIMWKEAQLHSICFSLRSCSAMLLLWAGLHQWRGVAVLAAHFAADEATRRYGQGIGTMRDMPWPPGYSKEFIDRVNFFYSTSQLLAIIGCLALAMDEAYLILLPVQIAAFLFTLVRKNIVSALTWHVVYGSTLMCGYVYLAIIIPIDPAWQLFLIGITAAVLRFRLRTPKYLIWVPLSIALLIHPPLFDPASGRMTTRFYTPPAVAAAAAAAKRAAAPSPLRSWKSFMPRLNFSKLPPAPPTPAPLGDVLVERLRGFGARFAGWSK